MVVPAFSSGRRTLEFPVRAAEDERERLLHELTSRAQEAFSHLGLVERRFRIDGHPFVLRVAGPQLASKMSRALEHLAVDDASEPGLVLNCWSAAESGTEFPMPRWPAEHFAGRGEIRGLDSPAMRIGYFDWIELLNVYFPEKRQAFYCCAREGEFPLQQLGSPALNIFNWWLGTLGCQLIHAAAVGTKSGAVLIAGHGGAGKSTLAFSTVDSPELRYISDDYCVLLPGSPPQVAALYGSGKLTECSLQLLPHLRGHPANNDDPSREKALFFLREAFPGAQLLQAPLRAIVLSELSSHTTALRPAAGRDVLSILADSTMRQLAGTAAPDFVRMLRLVQALPCYTLTHGADRTAAHRLLLQLCAS